MWERFQKIIDRIESRLALWLALGGSSVMALITGWLSTGVAWINQFGAFGWWVSGLLGFLITMLALLAFAWARYAWVRARTRRKWAEQVDQINPLDPEFTRKRISVRDLANPATNRVSKKRFIDCELVGPGNVVFHGTKDGGVELSHVNFGDCDVVVIPDRNAMIRHVIVLDDVQMIGGSMWGLTIFVHRPFLPLFKGIGANFVSMTGDQEIDNPRPQDTAEEKQP